MHDSTDFIWNLKIVMSRLIELLDQYVYSTWPKLGPDSHTLKLSSYHKPILTSNYCNLSLYK